MNERIKELWDQAAESTAAYTSGQNNSWETQVNFMEKFAELIVGQCLDIVLAPHNEAMMSVSMDLCKFSTREAINRAAQSGGLKVHTQGIANQIREHFGVEE